MGQRSAKSRDPPGHHHSHRQASLVPTFGACAGWGLCFVVLQGVADEITHVCQVQHSGVSQMLNHLGASAVTTCLLVQLHSLLQHRLFGFFFNLKDDNLQLPARERDFKMWMSL